MINRLFLDHPKSVEESYGQHFLFASRVSASLFYAAFAALLHALIPAACEKTASRTVAKMYAKTHDRGQ